MNSKLGWGFLGGAGRYQNCALYLWDTFYNFVSCTLEHLPKEVCFENKYPAPKINECLLRDDRWMFLGFKTWQQIHSESQPHVQRVECRMVQKILTTTDWGKLGPRSPQNIQANEFAVVECGEQTNAGAPNDSITSSLDTTYYSTIEWIQTCGTKIPFHTRATGVEWVWVRYLWDIWSCWFPWWWLLHPYKCLLYRSVVIDPLG